MGDSGDSEGDFRGHGNDTGGESGVTVALSALPAQRLVPFAGGERGVAFRVVVTERPSGTPTERPRLSLALVLDRSGSMSGEKLQTAKRAALGVVDRLDDRDRLAVVVFDDRIDVLQEAAPATNVVKARVRAALSRIEARATTALHEGWLRGCHAIASDSPGGVPDGIARCFLLTDGRANVGITDAEEIASSAALVRENAGVGTSTFGIGARYD